MGLFDIFKQNKKDFTCVLKVPTREVTLEELKELVKSGDLSQEEFDMLTQETSVSVVSQ